MTIKLNKRGERRRDKKRLPKLMAALGSAVNRFMNHAKRPRASRAAQRADNLKRMADRQEALRNRREALAASIAETSKVRVISELPLMQDSNHGPNDA